MKKDDNRASCNVDKMIMKSTQHGLKFYKCHALETCFPHNNLIQGNRSCRLESIMALPLVSIKSKAITIPTI